jgi:hypothetical protein
MTYTGTPTLDGGSGECGGVPEGGGQLCISGWRGEAGGMRFRAQAGAESSRSDCSNELGDEGVERVIWSRSVCLSVCLSPSLCSIETQGLTLDRQTLPLCQPFFCVGSPELFARNGIKPRSSRSLPLE